MSPAPLTGKVAVVTGATGGMGRVIAVELARAGAHVVTVARTPARADALREQIARHAGRDGLEVLHGDLSERDGVLAAADQLTARHDAVHLMVNNAGAHFSDRRVNADGVERHVAVDYLAAYGMMTLLGPALRKGRARVVNVVSDTIRDTRQVSVLGRPRPATLDPAELGDLTRLNPADGFVPFQAYARAKLLTVMAGYHLARTLADDGVTVNAVHPGIAATDIIDDIVPSYLRPFGGLIRRGMLTPEQGAASALRLATDPAADRLTGRYFVRDAEKPTPPVSYDTTLQARLVDTSDRFYLQ
ncbi:SDR family oxidoreductase [Myceligenerans cantabricum]